MKHLIEYMYYPVKIETVDGRLLEATVVSYENAVEHDLDSDTIDLDYGEWREAVAEKDILSIEIIGDRELPEGMEAFFS